MILSRPAAGRSGWLVTSGPRFPFGSREPLGLGTTDYLTFPTLPGVRLGENASLDHPTWARRRPASRLTARPRYIGPFGTLVKNLPRGGGPFYRIVPEIERGIVALPPQSG